MDRRAYLATVLSVPLFAGCSSNEPSSSGPPPELEEDFEIAQEQLEEDSSDDGWFSGGSESSNSYSVYVSYNDAWAGAVSTDSSSRSIEGTGTQTIDIEGDDLMVVSANAQKQDDSGFELFIEILENGNVVAEASTKAAFGIAQVSYTAN